MTSALAALVEELAAGRIIVVDLTQSLGPDTPVIGLPAIFAPSPGVSNVRDDGPHGPGFDQATSLLLATDRDVRGVGVETIGTDAGQAGRFDPPFPNHAIMHGHGKLGLASLCNLDRLPATGAVVIAAPLKLVGGSGSPVRAMALVDA